MTNKNIRSLRSRLKFVKSELETIRAICDAEWTQDKEDADLFRNASEDLEEGEASVDNAIDELNDALKIKPCTNTIKQP